MRTLHTALRDWTGPTNKSNLIRMLIWSLFDPQLIAKEEVEEEEVKEEEEEETLTHKQVKSNWDPDLNPDSILIQSWLDPDLIAKEEEEEEEEEEEWKPRHWFHVRSLFAVILSISAHSVTEFDNAPDNNKMAMCKSNHLDGGIRPFVSRLSGQ